MGVDICQLLWGLREWIVWTDWYFLLFYFFCFLFFFLFFLFFLFFVFCIHLFTYFAVILEEHACAMLDGLESIVMCPQAVRSRQIERGGRK
jgi:hypothetical protein